MTQFKKPKFWDKKKISLIAILLLPFSLITLLVIFIKKKINFPKSYKIPIICVGNIYVGGTGKTPTSSLIAKEFLKLGYKSAILRKYYKNHVDEYMQIKNNSINLIINKSRDKGILEAEKKGLDMIILDDGLQDYKIKKNFSIACFNQNQLIGNGLILPSGPLRESLSALKKINIVLINGDKNKDFEEKLLKINNKLIIHYSKYVPENINEFKGHKLIAVSGIANPENFFLLLKKNNLIVEEKFIYPDHYRFTKNEIQNIINIAEEKKLKIVMTEKDFFKVHHLGFDKLDYLKNSLEITDKKNFINKIKEAI